MELLSMVAQLILCITLIVGVHELGHLATAKWFGMRVEKYYIGFPPRIFSFKRGETEYGIGAIPLGGFVKITGMVDESMDTEALKQEPQPHEFRSKPAWQRLIVMLGGVFVNVVTGILMFILILYFEGETRTPIQDLNKQGIAAYPKAEKIGLQSGDKLLKFNGKSIEFLEEAVGAKVFLGSDGYYTIERDGKEMRINVPNDLVGKIDPRKEFFITPMLLFSVGGVKANSPADKAGMKKGDKIVEFNGKAIQYFHELEVVKRKAKGKKVQMVLDRQGKRIETTVQMDTTSTLGFDALRTTSFKTLKDYPSFVDAIGKGTGDAFSSVFYNIQGMGKVTKGEVPLDAVSGPLGMYQIFPPDWSRFWYITATLSMWLAFINIMPIPALDGGHAMFLTMEIISGRKIPEKVLERAQVVGMILLLTLMVFVLGNDLFKIIKNIIAYFS